MAGIGKVHLRNPDEVLLRVEDLVVEFPIGTTGDKVHAVSGISLDVADGETLGLVGESGCGKSTTGRAILQVPSPTSGSVVLESVDLTTLDDEAMRQTRPRLQMIFQDPISALNPRRSVRDIVADPLMVWWEEDAGSPPTSMWLSTYGGWFSRVASVITKPWRWIVAIASLAFVFWVVSEAVEERAWEDALSWTEVPAMIIGFPALAVILAMVAVLLAMGLVWLLSAMLVPFGVVSSLFGKVPALVGLGGAGFALGVMGFMIYRTWDSFDGWPAWAVARVPLIVLTAIIAVWFLASVARPSRAGASGVAAGLAALVFLEVFYVAGLDGVPKLGVLLASVAIDYLLFRAVIARVKRRRNELRQRAEPLVREMLQTVGINPDDALDRKPYEFSGGQAQRLSVARALIMEPKVIICDEPVSALDVSVQAQILNLLEQMKERYGLTLIFIAHDLAVVKNVSDRVAVMYLGKICEVAGPDDLYANPAHPYSQLLLSAIPHPDPLVDARVTQVAADLPSAVNPPSGCRFRTRCPLAQDLCASTEPQVREVAPDHYVACHFPLVGAVSEPGGNEPVMIGAEAAERGADR